MLLKNDTFNINYISMCSNIFLTYKNYSCRPEQIIQFNFEASNGTSVNYAERTKHVRMKCIGVIYRVPFKTP